MRTSLPEGPRRNEFFERVRPHLNALDEFVRHRLAYREALGDLVRGELAPEDVVDGVLLQAYAKFVQHRPACGVGSWLKGLAEHHVRNEVHRAKQWRRRTIKIEQDVPEIPPRWSVSWLGEEVLDFDEPDEDWKLEDLIPDVGIPTPEESVAVHEMFRLARQTIEGMPRSWRRALFLRYQRGFSDEALGKALGRTPAELRDILQRARDELRLTLADAGFRPKSHA